MGGDMTKNSKIRGVIFLVTSILFMANEPLFSQIKDNDTKNATLIENKNNTTGTQVDENTLLIDSPTENANNLAANSVNSVWVFVRMILALALVIVIIWLIFKFMKKGMKPGAENDPFLRKVASITLSPGKSVQIVTCINHAYIIGVSDNSVDLISTLDDKELIDAMNLYADKNQNTKKPVNFADVLDLFMPHGPREKSEKENKNEKKTGNVFSGSSKDVVDMIKKQRERLDNEEDNK